MKNPGLSRFGNLITHSDRAKWAPDWPAGSFDHPEEVSPRAHMMAEKLLPWSKIDDGLPRYPKFAPGDDHQDL